MLLPLEKSYYHLSPTLKAPLRSLTADSLCSGIYQLLATYDLPSALLQIARFIGQTFQAEGSLVATCNSALQLSELWEWSITEELELQTPRSPSNEFRYLFSHPTIQAEIEQSLLFMVPDLASWMTWADPSTVPDPVLAKIGSVLIIKTFFQGACNGFIGLTCAQTGSWSLADVEILKIVAHQVGTVLSQRVLSQQLQILEQRSQKATERQILLEQLTMAVQNSLELNEVLTLAVKGITHSLKVDQSMVLLLKYADPMLRHPSLSQLEAKLPSLIRDMETPAVVHTAGNDRDVPAEQRKRTLQIKATIACQWPSVEPPLELTSAETSALQCPLKSFQLVDCELCQLALHQSPNPIVIADWADHPDLSLNKLFAPLFQPNTMPALMMVPLASQGTVLGFLVIQHRKSRIWQPSELEFAQLVAMQISMAIIQLQTLRQVQALVEERTAQLHHSLDVQLKLYEVTRRQLNELQRLNQAKDEFLSAVSHELRTPLASMSLAIRMLRQPGLSNERYQRYLDILEQQCNQEAALVNDLLALQELEGQRSLVQTETVHLRLVLDELRQACAEKFASKQLQLKIHHLDPIFEIETDLGLLQRVLTELLTNASKYSYPNTEVHLNIQQFENHQAASVLLSVSNIGNGIAAQDLPHVFEKFWRGAGMTQQAVPGTGLGLALVKELVNHLGGTISVTSQPIAEDTDRPNAHQICFSVRLPRSL